MDLNALKSYKKVRCRKCDSTDVEVKTSGNRTGAYCRKCGAWIKWMSYEEIQKYYRKFKETKDSDNKAYKTTRKLNGHTIIKCSNCDTQLYNSGAGAPQGQFNLINAKYCPNCGMEFIY